MKTSINSSSLLIPPSTNALTSPSSTARGSAAQDFWSYLAGNWSVEYGVQLVPLDGFLFASRVVVAEEACRSSSVKDLIVAASDVADVQWERTYEKETDGILAVRSEFGEPIHKIATYGIKLWNFQRAWLGWHPTKTDGSISLLGISLPAPSHRGGGWISSILQSFTPLDQPHAFVEELFKKYPAGAT